MNQWNAVVTIKGRRGRGAVQVLRELGPIQKTGFFNVFLMQMENQRDFLEMLRERIESAPHVFDFLARISPMTFVFFFQNLEEFEEKAKKVVANFFPKLANKAFHVRVHRRGFKGRISTPIEERSLAEYIFDALEKAGNPGRISFTNFEAIVLFEIVGTQAGGSLWLREELERYPFIKPD